MNLVYLYLFSGLLIVGLFVIVLHTISDHFTQCVAKNEIEKLKEFKSKNIDKLNADVIKQINEKLSIKECEESLLKIKELDFIPQFFDGYITSQKNANIKSTDETFGYMCDNGFKLINFKSISDIKNPKKINDNIKSISDDSENLAKLICYPTNAMFDAINEINNLEKEAKTIEYKTSEGCMNSSDC